MSKEKRSLYRIIISSQNKILTTVYKTLYKNSALTAFTKIVKENKKEVRFPVKYSSRDHKLIPSKYEILLLKTKDDENEVSIVRNDFGKLVPHNTNSEKMVIYKKESFLFEETFWIYGMNPKSQRVTYDYIYEKVLMNGVAKVRYPQKIVYVYRNKLIIEDDNDFEIIICKCEDDSVRLYNELEKDIIKTKYKSVVFFGIANRDVSRRLELKMLQKTGWDIKKIRRKTTRP